MWLRTVRQFDGRNFYTLRVKTNKACLTPQEAAIDQFIETPYALLHALKNLGSLSFVLRVTVINPFIGYPSRERGLSRDPPSLFILTFFPHNVQQPPKQMKGFVSKLLSRRRHISISRVAIGKRHKSGIHRRVRQSSIQIKVNNAKSYAAGLIDIGPLSHDVADCVSALKSYRK